MRFRFGVVGYCGEKVQVYSARWIHSNSVADFASFFCAFVDILVVFAWAVYGLVVVVMSVVRDRDVQVGSF